MLPHQLYTKFFVSTVTKISLNSAGGLLLRDSTLQGIIGHCRQKRVFSIYTSAQTISNWKKEKKLTLLFLLKQQGKEGKNKESMTPCSGIIFLNYISMAKY